MRIFIKILLFPIALILTIVVNVSAFLVGRIGGVLKIIAGLLFTAGIIMCGFAIFKSDIYSWGTPIILAVVSFIISPYGLPKFAAWLVGKLDDLNDFIKEI